VTPPALSVVIVNWNTRDLLAACLSALEASDFPAEAIIVDNGSADGSAEMVRSLFPAARLIANAGNEGFARASNQGMELARGRYLCLLNSDTEVCPDALPTLVRFMETRSAAGACGPRLLNSDGTLQVSAHPMLTPGRELWRLLFLDRVRARATYPMSQWDADTPRQVDALKGACMMLRREALDQTGLLDETYFMYTEEVDLCYRLAQRGWEVWWVPQAEVIHHGEASTRQARAAMYAQLYRSKTQFFRKAGGEREARRFKRYLRIAYGPRWAAAAVAGAVKPEMRRRRSLYGRLLGALDDF
jgi:GT2 family glycosyltransferase